MTRALRILTGGLVVALLASPACYLDTVEAPNGNGGGARAGRIIVNLVTPNTDDGVVRITFTGPVVTTPQADPSTNFVVYSTQRTQQTLDVIVVGDLTAGATFSVPVTDIDRVGEYSASVTEAAAQDDVLRSNLSGYGASLVASVN